MRIQEPKCPIRMNKDPNHSICIALLQCPEENHQDCDFSPYRDDYQPVTNVPIVQAATAWPKKPLRTRVVVELLPGF